MPNPDGSSPDPSRDFDGQGLANIAAGFFQGMPLGGSLSTTSINVNAGAKTRWSNIFSGVFVAILVLLFARLVELIPMSSVAAILIVAGWGTINFEEIADVRDSGIAPRLIMIFTFVVTLFLPMQTAVFIGVILSVVYFVYDSAINVRVVQLVPQEDGSLLEQAPPDELSSNDITMLHVYGTVFFAAAYTLEQVFPSPLKAQRAVVILHLRGYQDVGSTFIGVMERYAQKLQETGGKLVLCGVSEGGQRAAGTNRDDRDYRRRGYLYGRGAADGVHGEGPGGGTRLARSISFFLDLGHRVDQQRVAACVVPFPQVVAR